MNTNETEPTDEMVEAAFRKIWGITRSDIPAELVREVARKALVDALAAGVTVAPATLTDEQICQTLFPIADEEIMAVNKALIIEAGRELIALAAGVPPSDGGQAK